VSKTSKTLKTSKTSSIEIVLNARHSVSRARPCIQMRLNVQTPQTICSASSISRAILSLQKYSDVGIEYGGHVYQLVETDRISTQTGTPAISPIPSESQLECGKMSALESENKRLRADLQYHIKQKHMKDAHNKHLKYMNKKQTKFDISSFYRLNARPMKTFKSFKAGLDMVFRLNLPVVLETRKGDILITGQQGHGGYGRVANGYHLQYNMERVVVKEFVGFDQRKNKTQYKGELETLKSLCSKVDDALPLPYEYIPHYIDKKEEDGNYFIVSAHAGDDMSKLDDYQREHLIGHIGSSIVMILKAVHEKGYIHRDIKPQNVCLDENDIVRVIDVGAMVKMDGVSREVVTTQKYNDFEHCSLNMHGASSNQKRCTITPIDDLWMTLFALMEISGYVPKYWSDPKRTKNIIDDKQKITSQPREYFSKSSKRDEAMIQAVEYLRTCEPKSIDYNLLASVLSRL